MNIFYKYAPLLSAVLCACITLIIYFLESIFRPNHAMVLWPCLLIVATAAGFIWGKLIKQLSLSSYTDFLTGLWNRRYFYVRLAEERARALRQNTPICIAMIDVDDFKAVNDTYGHDEGDTVLIELAGIFRNNTRATDIVSRIGGDEFAIIFFDTKLVDALRVMERIRGEFAHSLSTYDVTLSAGIITLEPGQDLKELVAAVDKALYKAKNRKNSVSALQY